jgi:hypothetical protein
VFRSRCQRRLHAALRLSPPIGNRRITDTERYTDARGTSAEKRKEAKKKQTRQKMALPRRGGTYLQAIQTLHRGLGTPFLERFYSVASI